MESLATKLMKTMALGRTERDFCIFSCTCASTFAPRSPHPYIRHVILRSESSEEKPFLVTTKYIFSETSRSLLVRFSQRSVFFWLPNRHFLCLEDDGPCNLNVQYPHHIGMVHSVSIRSCMTLMFSGDVNSILFS